MTTLGEYSQPPAGPTTFRVILNCTTTKARMEKKLCLEQPPETVAEVKEQIQSKFKVPKCCQTLYFDSVLLREGESLDTYRIRDMDVLNVDYNSEADIEEVLDIISTMRKMITFIVSIQPELSSERISQDLDTRIVQNINARLVESLPSEYFFPFVSEQADANRLLFIHNGGVEVMHELHVMLLKQPWRTTPLEMQHLEDAVLRTLHNLTALCSVRTPVLRRQTLNAIMESMLRVQIIPSKPIKAPYNGFANQSAPVHELDQIVSAVLFEATCSLCNLLEEFAECRLQVASNERVLNQFVAIMLTPTYKYGASQVAVTGLLNLAYSPETHQYLAKPYIIKGVIEACGIQRTTYQLSAYERMLECLLLKYFATLLFALMTTWSLELIPPSLLPMLHTFIEQFLSTADYQVIRQQEAKYEYIWSTIVPFVNLAYFPYLNPKYIPSCSSSDEHQTVRQLQLLCIEAGVFSLQNMLSGNQTREILIQEELVDYVVCMPWYVPLGSRAQKRAHKLVSCLGQTMQLQPPRLVNMVRAKLAALHFGLEKVQRTTSVHALLAEVLIS